MNLDTQLEAAAKVIEDAIRGYKLQYTVNEDDGSAYDLLDALTPPGAKNIGLGRKEVEMLVDHVAGEMRAAIAAFQAGAPRVEIGATCEGCGVTFGCWMSDPNRHPDLDPVPGPLCPGPGSRVLSPVVEVKP